MAKLIDGKAISAQIKDECREKVAQMKAEGVEDFNLEAQLFLCAATGKTREELYRDIKLYAMGGAEKRVEELMGYIENN